jgi:hypothetical protein
MVVMTVVAATVLAASVSFGAGFEVAPAGTISQQAAAAPSIAPADLAPFLGDWALTLNGPDRAAAMVLSIRSEKDKPAGDLSSEAMPKQAISDFSMADKTLVMNYSFTWEGNPVSAVISMTPAADGPMKAQIDFAGGAYVMTGTAAKKDKEK